MMLTWLGQTILGVARGPWVAGASLAAAFVAPLAVATAAAVALK